MLSCDSNIQKSQKAQGSDLSTFVLRLKNQSFFPYLISKEKKGEELFDSPFPGRTCMYTHTKTFRAQESKRQETGFVLSPLLSRLTVYIYRKVECAENCGDTLRAG